MSERKAVIEQLSVPSGKRLLAISDIHGNLPYFRALLEKAGFCAEDELILCGDFLEKGPDSLGTLRYIMELCRKGNVHALCGNCDGWGSVFHREDERDAFTLNYVKRKKSGFLWEACLACGIDPMTIEALADIKPVLSGHFRQEIEFLDALPHAIETEHGIFAHGAVYDKPLSAHTVDELTHCDAYMEISGVHEKWVIVGHWPVMLYGRDKVCANPVINREKHIVSIDGGCVLKDDGQLNALIVPTDGSEEFSWIAYDPFPVRRVKTAQAEGKSSYYIRWGDSRVQVLHRGEEFSRCRHVRTGYEMDILTRYLFTDKEFTDCNDCTDYIPALSPGDEVSVVETSSRGYFVKHKGYSGWYYGELI